MTSYSTMPTMIAPNEGGAGNGSWNFGVGTAANPNSGPFGVATAVPAGIPGYQSELGNATGTPAGPMTTPMGVTAPSNSPAPGTQSSIETMGGGQANPGFYGR